MMTSSPRTIAPMVVPGGSLTSSIDLPTTFDEKSYHGVLLAVHRAVPWPAWSDGLILA